MIIKPMIRSNICINAHPAGCAKEVDRQIEYVQKKTVERGITVGEPALGTPKSVLVLGCSTGYGLASRISSTFQYGAASVGVSFEKEPTETKGGTPGFYNNMAFDLAAKKQGIFSSTLNGDAFSDDMRKKVIEVANHNKMKFDLVVYSLASPVRTDPDTGILYKSAIKPFGKPYSGQTVDMMTGKLSVMSAEPANEDEAAQTVKVMGGEDWERWIDQLTEAGVLANNCITVAYSYIGPELSHAIYRDGTIGGAKKHLEKTARSLSAKMNHTLNGQAFVSVNKGLVTRSSAVIPIIPLYLSVLFSVMKAKGTHEGCIEQMERLFAERLFIRNTDGSYKLDGAKRHVIPVDTDNLIRIDDFEMDSSVQSEVNRRLEKIATAGQSSIEGMEDLADLIGYRHDFMAANGFDVEGVDYEKDTPRMDVI